MSPSGGGAFSECTVTGNRLPRDGLSALRFLGSRQIQPLVDEL